MLIESAFFEGSLSLKVLIVSDSDSRLKADQQSSAEHESFKMEYFWASALDWKTYLYAAIYMYPLPSPSI